MKTSLYGSRSFQIKSIKDWNNIIDKIHFTTEDFMKCSRGYQKNKKCPSVIKLFAFFVPLVSFCFSVCLSHVIYGPSVFSLPKS